MLPCIVQLESKSSLTGSFHLLTFGEKHSGYSEARSLDQNDIASRRRCTRPIQNHQAFFFSSPPFSFSPLLYATKASQNESSVDLGGLVSG